MQSCAGDNYAQVVVVADKIAQIKLRGTHNATALELCKAMKKTWQMLVITMPRKKTMTRTMTAK
jgi:hypothetical protein